ncbi:MAG: DUF692 domain-containing protein [Proteobacteria bacterium]|nr:DUF692 domain-containing protein [Pseudomonadota bacterium]HQR03394.1 DUF692 domain-containing protein [Rhodocyclaceae bacterium]
MNRTASCMTDLPRSAGMGLRAPHHADILASPPDVGWLEVHSENFFAAGGETLRVLEAVRERFPISLHGVGLSLGGGDALSDRHLGKLKALVDRIDPAAVSEHLCWSSVDGHVLNDLLPMPCTRAALDWMDARVSRVQERLGRTILVENLSSYLRFARAEMPEWDFLSALTRRTGCGVLLDINNIYVSACNHGFDARDYLAGIGVDQVGELHLAGFEAEDGFLVDTHSRPIQPPVWTLYAEALARFGPQPTLIEWDHEIPALDVLVAEVRQAQSWMDRCREVAHVRAA